MMPGLRAAGSIMRPGTERQISASLAPQVTRAASHRPTADAAAAGSEDDVSSTGVVLGSSGSVSMSAGGGVGHREVSVLQPGTLKASTLYWVTNPDSDISGSSAAVKGGPGSGPGPVPAAPAGPEQQDSLAAGIATSQPGKRPVLHTEATESWEAAPPPPSPRLLAAAIGSEAADKLAAAALPAEATAGTAAAAAEEVQEMLATPSTGSATGCTGDVESEAPAAAASVFGFTAPVTLQQQQCAVSTAAGSIYPLITARGASTELRAASPGATAAAACVPSRLTAVQGARHNSLTGLSLTRQGSTQPRLTQPAPARSISGAALAAASRAASLLAPVAGAALATGAAVLPAVAGSLAAAVTGLTVFLLQQATWLFNIGWLLGGRLLLWAALAGPRAVLSAARQFGPYLAGSFSSKSSRHSAVVPMLGEFRSSRSGQLGSVQVGGATTGGSRSRILKGGSTSWLLQRLPHGSINNATTAVTAGAAAAASPPAAEAGISPAVADMRGARCSPSGPSANHSHVPPSLGGPGFRVWAPSAGSGTAASIAAAALSPAALLLQWPARTVTILFEVAVWVVFQLLIGPLTLLLGVLRYSGLLSARSPGRPALSSVAAAGGFAAQGQIMPPPGANALPAPLPQTAATAVPTSSATDPDGTVLQAGEVAMREAEGSVSGGGGVSELAPVPLSATAVPEEHEVCGEEVVSPSGRIISPSNVPFSEMPPTPAPSLEVCQL
jgi:hypothetical protein